MVLHAFLSLLLWPYALEIVFALFFVVLRLFVCLRASIPCFSSCHLMFVSGNAHFEIHFEI